MDGEFFPIKEAFSEYLVAWYNGLQAYTPAMQEYIERGSSLSLMWAPSRMGDAVDEMLASYRRNENVVAKLTAAPALTGAAPLVIGGLTIAAGDAIQVIVGGQSTTYVNAVVSGVYTLTRAKGNLTKFPIVIAAMARSIAPTSADWGRQLPRRMVRITDESPIYGYRQAMEDINIQVAFIAQEDSTAHSLATQYGMHVANSRSIYSNYKFGQWNFDMPAMIENPDVFFQSIPIEGQPTVVVLTAEITLKCTIPYFDAPKAGDPNDGSNYDPQGYPPVTEVDILSYTSRVHSNVTEDETIIEPF